MRPELTSELLVRRFGGGSELARAAVSSFYGVLVGDGADRVQAFLQAWTAEFEPFYGPLQSLSARIINPLARRLGLEPETVNPAALLFALHTYYAILAKLFSLWVIFSSDRARLGPRWEPEELAAYLRDNLTGPDAFHRQGLLGFWEGGLFDWYLEAWDHTVASAVGKLARALAQYSPPRPEGEACGGDWLQRLYQHLFPSGLRHRLGEYYTPAWLTETLLDRVLEGEASSGLLERSFLDPACGSGPFLVAVIRRMRKSAREQGLPPDQTLEKLLHNVVGFDRNPLAVLSARVNYLLAVADLLPYRREEVEIPAYRADALLFPPGRWEHYFDYVVGNPPWVNWEALPQDYRDATRPLWEYYGLFPHGGLDTILGSGKKDLSMLITYATTDRYLRPYGKLGFLVTQAVFKTAGAGQGFRRLVLPTGVPLGVRLVEDLSELRPFAGTNNRTCLLVWQKGVPTRYPVPYYYWQPLASPRSRTAPSLAEVLSRVRVRRLAARPVAEDPASPWVTEEPAALEAIAGVLGRSEYRAHEGANTGGANGVYWVRIMERRPDGLAVVANLAREGKRRAEEVRAVVEADLVYPLLRARDLDRWQARPSAWILLVQDPQRRRGRSEEEMRARYPRIYAYLKRFEPLLRERAAFRRYFCRRSGGELVETAPFYSMFDVGEYTLAPHKVVWARVASALRAAVVTAREGKPVVPQETVTLVATSSPDEAHYLCAVINSRLFNRAAQAYSQKGGKSFGSGHLLQYLRVPRFDRKQGLHRDLASLSHRAHVLKGLGDGRGLAEVEAEIERAVVALWSPTVG
ncbi:MAG: HsdM family class I SAM-dependent methyltransferase [Moorellales bacterium]